MISYQFRRKFTSLILPLTMVLAVNAGNNPFSPNPIDEFYWIQIPLSCIFIVLFVLKVIRYKAVVVYGNLVQINDLWLKGKAFKFDDVKSMDVDTSPHHYLFILNNEEEIKLPIRDLKRTDLDKIQSLFDDKVTSSRN